MDFTQLVDNQMNFGILVEVVEVVVAVVLDLVVLVDFVVDLDL